MIGTPDTSAYVLINGAPFGGWKDFQVTQTFDQASGDGSLRMSPQPGNPLPVKIGDKIAFICAGQPVLTGYVRRVWGEHSIESHEIQAQCRDKTDDLRQSTIGPKHNIDPPCSLKDVAEQTLKTMGLTDIQVIDKLNAAPFDLGEKISGAIDEGGHEHIERWASRRNAVMTTDGKGNLVLDNNRGQRLAGAFIHFGLPDDPLNNVVKSQFGIDDFNRHNTQAVAGQQSANTRKWENESKNHPDAQANRMASRYGIAHDRSVRPQLRRHSRAGKGSSKHSPRESAKWRANTMRAKSNEYVVTVAGFTTPGGALWWPGFIVPVYDYWWGLKADLFLKDVSFTKAAGDGGANKGATTQLKFTLEDGYKPQAGRTPSAGRTGGALPGDPGEVHETPSPAELGIDDPETEVEMEP